MPRGKKKRRFGWPSSWSLSASRHFALACALLGSAGLLSLLEPYVWIGALLRELGFHLGGIASFVALTALAKRAWLASALLFALTASFAWPLAPLYRTTRPTPQAGPILRVATAHLAGNQLESAELAAWLAREQPDALALTGLQDSTVFGARVGAYRVLRGSTELRALLLVQDALIVPSRPHPSAYPSQAVRAGRCQARLVAVELPPLSVYTTLSARERGIAALANSHVAPRSIWLGHFGSRADAHDLDALRRQHALRDGRLGHGRAATAPAVLGALGFPLSHVLVHGWISVREYQTEAPLVDGAHRSVRATLELTEPRCRFTRNDALE